VREKEQEIDKIVNERLHRFGNVTFDHKCVDCLVRYTCTGDLEFGMTVELGLHYSLPKLSSVVGSASSDVLLVSADASVVLVLVLVVVDVVVAWSGAVEPLVSVSGSGKVAGWVLV
jgi:hypothetical protein